MSPEVRTVALDPLVNGLLAPVRRQELVELIDDLVVAGDAQLRAQLGEVGEDGVVGPGVVGILLPQHAAEAVAVGVHSLEHPGGHLRQCDELPLAAGCLGTCSIVNKKDSVSLDTPFIQSQPQGLTPNTRPL